MKSDIEIARSIELKKVKQVAESIGIPRDEVENYGRYIAKIPEQLIDEEKVKAAIEATGYKVLGITTGEAEEKKGFSLFHKS